MLYWCKNAAGYKNKKKINTCERLKKMSLTKSIKKDEVLSSKKLSYITWICDVCVIS